MGSPQGLGLVSWLIIPQNHVPKTGSSDPGVPELSHCQQR